LTAWQLALVVACSSNCGSSSKSGTGGTGGQATGGMGTGGAGATGGKATDGTGGAGGQVSTGGSSTGGAGGSATGGSATGGNGQGGQGGKGGAATGGKGDGGANGGQSGAGCQDSSLLFCEDFETLATGAASSSHWTNEVSTGTTAGTLTIDNMHSRGAKALHIHTVGNGRGLIHVKNFAPPANSFYGRMWMWVDAFPSRPITRTSPWWKRQEPAMRPK